MHVDVEIEHPRVHFQQFQDADDDIVDVAEPTGLCFFGVVVSSCPVDDNVRYPREHNVGSIDASSSCQLAKMIQPVKSRTVKGLVDLEEAF